MKGLAHITGGGFPDNIPRVLPKGLGARIDLAQVPVPPVFKWLAARRRHRAERNAAHFQLRHRHDRHRRAEGRRRGGAGVHRRRRKGGQAIGSVMRAAGEARVVYDGKLDLG